MQKPINIFGNRIFQAFRIMRTFTRQRKERTLQMRSKNVRASTHHATHGLKIGAHHVKRVGDQTEHLTGGAVHHMTCASHAYALHTIIEGTPPRTVRMNVDVTGSHHAACSVGHETGRTGHGIAETNRTDRIGISIGIQTDACACRSKIIVPIPSRNNRATIGNQPLRDATLGDRHAPDIDFMSTLNQGKVEREHEVSLSRLIRAESRLPPNEQARRERSTSRHVRHHRC